ncbi:hypothetical protein ACS0KU_000352 [Vibrio alginolyticus]|uniref:hypothetical protein n=1 Tax=Vibrio TaxID=662 RepID=UPI0015587793|nr:MULTISPECIES: hypothetical protein [Vibrio]EGQ7901879.1 hypothetical protein [Vibrio alginolyticus]EJS2611116.1 hypothetical protein [Vibrio alginolyticus]ELA6637431.1 hypothetical protein [Vibrio alginolyticus]ELK9266351.1 hypothetical protein [Vibrio alginolyticus]ELN6904500.1 hypothetical protein [Vibrio alginolyticus]
MFWILGLLVSLFIMYSDYAHYFYTKRHGKKSRVSRLLSLLITVTLPMIATIEILNDLNVEDTSYQVCVVLVSALVGLLVCLSEQYRFKSERD